MFYPYSVRGLSPGFWQTDLSISVLLTKYLSEILLYSLMTWFVWARTKIEEPHLKAWSGGSAEFGYRHDFTCLIYVILNPSKEGSHGREAAMRCFSKKVFNKLS